MNPSTQHTTSAGFHENLFRLMTIVTECSVCTDELTNECAISVCPCGHIFHRNCLDQWLKQCRNQPVCPTCRSKASRSQIVKQLYVRKLCIYILWLLRKKTNCAVFFNRILSVEIILIASSLSRTIQLWVKVLQKTALGFEIESPRSKLKWSRNKRQGVRTKIRLTPSKKKLVN